MKKKNILLQVHYIPVHLQPFYCKNFGFKENDYPNAENYYRQEISLPIYPSLTKHDQQYVINSIYEIFNGGF